MGHVRDDDIICGSMSNKPQTILQALKRYPKHESNKFDHDECVHTHSDHDSVKDAYILIGTGRGGAGESQAD